MAASVALRRLAWHASLLLVLAFAASIPSPAQTSPAGGSNLHRTSTAPTPKAPRAGFFDATELHAPTDLGAPWLIHAGDDPAYARPDFDDSHWTAFDPHDELNKVFPKDHPHVVWYRQRIQVDPTTSGLAIEEWNISSAFEVYVNGVCVMQTGSVAPFAPDTYIAKLLYAIPASQIATGSLVVALRVHITDAEWLGSGPGFFYTNLTLGQETQLRDHIWLTFLGEKSVSFLNRVLIAGLGMVGLALFIAQRQQREYLWLALYALTEIAALPITLAEQFRNVPIWLDLANQAINLFNLLFLLLMYGAFLRVRFNWWLRVLLGIAALGDIYYTLARVSGLTFSYLSFTALSPIVLILAGVLPIRLVVHWRRGNREAGILLIPVVLYSLYYYANFGLALLSLIPALTVWAIKWNNQLTAVPAGPFVYSLQDIGNLLFSVTLAVILVQRSIRMSRQQAHLEGELEAARQVQQVILPESAEEVPGFLVESVYQPARQVGGDFFQVLPTENGGLLLVLGDVAGKGLPAAMLVSVLVGAIRAAADYTQDPAELLANLNERLVGRANGGFSTALAALISANGTVTIANAGHLSPYLDGREAELKGALPLGVQSGAVYETTRFHLPAGSRLTFYSDGVVEAQNEKGEMFGFDRAEAISARPAEEIAEAAKRFGQNDDITVVGICRKVPVADAA